MKRLLYGVMVVCGALVSLLGCSAQQALNAVIPDNGYRLNADLAYGERPRQRLDVYTPRAAPAPPPVVIFFYGGRWSEGDKAGYRFAAQALTARGFVAVLPDYRLYPQVRFPAFVEDGAAAVAWVRGHIAEYGGDPAEIFLMGHSAGAHIAAMLTLDERFLAARGLSASTDLAGFIGLAGPYDFLPLKADDLKDMFGPPEDYPASQPINFVDAGQPPLLLLHGLDDTTVLPRNSRHLAAASRAVDAPVETVFYPGLGHVGLVASLAAPLRFHAAVLEDTVEFLRRHSGGEAAAAPRTGRPVRERR